MMLLLLSELKSMMTIMMMLMGKRDLCDIKYVYMLGRKWSRGIGCDYMSESGAVGGRSIICFTKRSIRTCSLHVRIGYS